MTWADILVGYLIFVGALVFDFVAAPLDQILTTSEQLCKVPWGTYFNTTSQIDVSNGGQSPELIGVGCEVNVRIWGQITDYLVSLWLTLTHVTFDNDPSDLWPQPIWPLAASEQWSLLSKILILVQSRQWCISAHCTVCTGELKILEWSLWFTKAKSSTPDQTVTIYWL